MKKLSVIICSHNSRPAHLIRTLEALRAQDLDPDAWELILVDNCSDSPVSDRFSRYIPAWGRVVHEGNLGLTHARIRGISEAVGEKLVLVDDDNLLAPDYLREAYRLGCEFPDVGVWGGSVLGEFESPVPDWMLRHLGVLAVRKVTEMQVSNDLRTMRATPMGAGMVIRRKVGEAYLQKLEDDPIRKRLDRCGRNFLGGGDRDLARTSAEVGMFWAVFPSLKLTHLIPRERLEKDYFLNLWRGGIAATRILKELDDIPSQKGRRPGLNGIRHLIRSFRRRREHNLIREQRIQAEGIVEQFFEENSNVIAMRK